MAIDKFDGKFAVKTRDVVRDDYLRAYRFRIPAALTDEGTQPYVDASVFADNVAPLYLDAQLCANATSSTTSSGTALDEDGAAIGVLRQPEGQATGYVTVSTASGGGLINAGTVLKYPANNLQFKTLITNVYHDGDLVAVEAVLAGPAGNLDGGLQLQFVSPPVGISALATIFTNTNGNGLEGGADAEKDDAYRKRQALMRQEPPAAGNESQSVLAVESIRGIAIEKAFVRPGVFGPGTKSVMFTMRPSKSGGSRIPNGVQVAQVQSILQDAFPGDDGIFVEAGLDDLVTVAIKVIWKSTAIGWVDAIQWPLFYADPVHVVSATASGATITSSTSIAAPVVGQRIGFYNSKLSTFAKKTISSVSVGVANHTYTLAFDMTTPGASDPTFTPAVGANVSPWSDSLVDTVAPILAYFDKQGPGEDFATFADPGRRQRRYPPPDPDTYPNKVENRLVDGLFAVVEDAQVALPASLPLATTFGTPGVTYYLHKLGDLSVHPE